ncbi:hypothetical protein BDW02DRAFT_563703 [Decorospora gaudefroyi]|uniref:Flavin reductase like domain-containing protein n=1 Tax=Decorospora gaudefroyi TaxID=184978 RepID=A0A6A5KX89_9PLEO|nr:hypothetical protein BDW02DRAFT_563703 [Decorospora gaudefroyi]
MALSHRPPSHFFAAFYRWNIHTQRRRPCVIASQCALNITRSRDGICTPRDYHATRPLRQQDQPERKVQAENGTAPNELVQGISGRGGQRILRPADAPQEEAATKQPSTDEHETQHELLDPELETEKLKTSVRSLMRNVPSSVAVVTATCIDPDSKQRLPVGVAVSSLSTVTLDPPTISFNLKEPSKTLDAIRAADGRFRVHFPAADGGGAKAVELFCRGNHADAYDLRTKQLKIVLPKSSYKNYPSTTTPSLAPQLWDDFILGAMECTVTHELPVADHVILVAKINTMENKKTNSLTILYVDGGYRHPKGDTIYTAGRTRPLSDNEGVSSVWDFPLFPGIKERQHYLEQIKTMVKGNPAYHDTPSNKESYRQVDANLPWGASNLGINLRALIAECRKELGLSDGLKPGADSLPILSDFYGPLTPSMINQIVDRAKKLVAMDTMFLSQHYAVFMAQLGVSPGARDILPSDIMQPLREEGLAPPFEPRRGFTERGTLDITKAEQIEYHLREHLRRMTYDAALKLPFESAMEAIGEKKITAIIFKKARSRLLSQTHPALFAAPEIDIAGEVTQEEIRLVICRLINRLHVHSQNDFRKQISMDWCETLRRLGVNPTITGMSVEFLWGKVKHLYLSTRKFREFPRAIDKMLEPWFVWNVSWDDLEERVKQLIVKNTLRATRWSPKDRLAAMGLHWEATVTLPSEDALDGKVKQPLSQGHILETLVAKELKKHYGKGTEEENECIASYLKETYHFDVTLKPTVYIPGASPSKSSSDEMREAMMASLSVRQEQAWPEPIQQSYTQPQTVVPRKREESWKVQPGTDASQRSTITSKRGRRHVVRSAYSVSGESVDPETLRTRYLFGRPFRKSRRGDGEREG